MKIYIYSIIDSDKKIDDSINGLKGSNVYNIPFRDIGAAVSDLDEQIQDVTRDNVFKHEEIVEKMMKNFTVLPLRFLTVFNTKKDVISMMEYYYDDFRQNLDRLKNKVEFGIKVIWPGNTIKKRIRDAFNKTAPSILTSADSAAQSFLKEKFENHKIEKEFEEEATKCIAIVDEYFNQIIARKKLQKLQSENLLLNAAYLVEKEKQEEFKQAFEQLRRTSGELKFLFSGPWAPYNFIALTRESYPQLSTMKVKYDNE